MESKAKKRDLELVVISDTHLGTYGCHAKELLRYLKSINPSKVILNGDIIDIWQFSKHYWPKSHMKVVKYIIGWIAQGKEVYYITGNHDEMLRKFIDFSVSSFTIKNKVVLELDGKKAWFFHGDVFDVTMKHSKWLAKLGAVGYDTLIVINKAANYVSQFLGKGKLSLSKKIKNSVKSAVKFIDDFEETAIQIAQDKQFDYVVCGHIHQPVIREVVKDHSSLLYLNSGDWIENLTALEYHNSQWTLFNYMESNLAIDATDNELEQADLIDKTSKEIFGQLVAEVTLQQ